METKLKQYAELVVKKGVNLKSGQTLVVRSPIECAPFTRAVVEKAYQAGAGDVVIAWSDEICSKLNYTLAPESSFDRVPSWLKELYLSTVREDAAYISISASDPEIMKDVNPERIKRYQRAYNREVSEYVDRLMSNENAWCVVSVPTVAWAQKVFPELSGDAAVNRLWEAIFEAVRMNEADPVSAWDVHKKNLERRMNRLNAHQFSALHFSNSAGTDLTVGLPEGHIWLGGADRTKSGHEFIANMPTEEVFTAPKRDGVNGRVVSALPLNLNGTLIEDFEFEFKDGRVIQVKARTGESHLKSLLETDDGAEYLGEVALVPYDSPISNSGILFYNTLFDENAACHLALGNAYPVCLKGAEGMDKETLRKHGINTSIVHEDFMVGTSDMQIDGIESDGKKVPVFRNGNFVGEFE
ncbi:MAG: aminopeptidase [Clostridiales bacterium]|jgi:aminopeptidase|nr:aminopeptidase [Clostridiales bacterium]